MKTLVAWIVLILLAGAGRSQEAIRVPANFDDEGNCADLVVGYGQFLEPINGFWIFTVEGDTIMLNGLPFDPLRTVGEQWSAPPKDISPLVSAKFDLARRSGIEYKRAGLGAAAQVFRESSFVDSVFVNVNENSIWITYTDGGTEEANYLTRAQEEARQNRGPQPTRLDRFRELIEQGQGFVFGTDVSVNIPILRKQAFAEALRKLHDNELLSIGDREELPLFREGFRRDVGLK